MVGRVSLLLALFVLVDDAAGPVLPSEVMPPSLSVSVCGDCLLSAALD